MLKRPTEQEWHDNVKTTIRNPLRKLDSVMCEAGQFVQKDDGRPVSLPEERDRAIICRERFFEESLDCAHARSPVIPY